MGGMHRYMLCLSFESLPWTRETGQPCLSPDLSLE